MPNHVKNKLTLVGTKEQVQEVLDTFGTHVPARLYTAYEGSVVCENENKEIGWFDLKTGRFYQREKESIQGLPDGWELEIIPASFYFPDFEKIIPPPDDPAYRDEPSQKEAEKSPNWWHTWNRKNWGSKWSAYDCEKLAENVFTFDTAWSTVPKIIKAMSRRFPDVGFECEYADEDFGSNTGRYVFVGGECEEQYIPESQSTEAYELAFKVRPELKEFIKLVDGEYRYIDADF